MSSRRPEPKPDGLVSIWCDHPSHAKTLTVVQFYPVHGIWQEWRSRAQSGGVAQATLIGDEPFDRERHRGLEVRYRDRIECRKYGQCRQSVLARQEKLFAVLDKMVAANVYQTTLTALAASLERIAD